MVMHKHNVSDIAYPYCIFLVLWYMFDDNKIAQLAVIHSNIKQHNIVT